MGPREIVWVPQQLSERQGCYAEKCDPTECGLSMRKMVGPVLFIYLFNSVLDDSYADFIAYSVVSSRMWPCRNDYVCGCFLFIYFLTHSVPGSMRAVWLKCQDFEHF